MSRTLPIELVRATVAFGRRHGWDVDRLLELSGVSPGLLAEGRSRVTEEQLVSVVQALWQVTDDEMFGLGTHPLPRGSFRLLCYGVIGAPDVRSALERFSGFTKAMPALPTPSLTIEDGESVVGLPPFRIGDTHPETVRLVSLVTAMGLHRFVEWMIDDRVALSRVDFPHPRPAQTEIYDLVLGGAPVVFDAPRLALVADAAVLRAAIVRDEADVEELVARSPSVFLGRINPTTTTAGRVRRMIEQSLADGVVPSATDLASGLAISTETLRRHLLAEDTSVRRLTDEVRRDLAVTSLVAGEESMSDLSARLGFSEPSAFARAFRRWTGSTPGAYRREPPPR